jgi:hypothetical protein
MEGFTMTTNKGTNKGTENKGKEETKETIEHILPIMNISSGKEMILSYIDGNKKQFDFKPFQLKPRNDYYDYQHHLDLREGKGDIETLHERFPEILPLSKMNESEKYKGIKRTSYTQLIRYLLIERIISGDFDILGREGKDGKIHNIKFEWKGEENIFPTIRKEKEKTGKGKGKTSIKDLLNDLI